MESCKYKIIEKCRICDISVTEGDFVPLFITSELNIEKTHSGELFEELIELPCTDETSHPYICNGCDLQMKLFKRLKEKAWKMLTINADTEETSSATADVSESIQCLEEEKVDNCLESSSIIYEINDENISSDLTLATYFENAITKNQSSSSKTTENDDFIIVYDTNEHSLGTVSIEDLIEEDKSSDNVNQNDKQIIVFANANFDDETSGNPLTVDKENEEDQYITNTGDSSSKINPKENSPMSTEIECSDCGLNVSKLSYLNRNRQKSKVRKHQCQICQKLFKSIENLNGHMRQHLGLPAYECEICKKTFNQKVHFQYHMNTHSNKRDFACSLCDKNYLSKSDLVIHIKRAHKGERNFVCEFENCGKRFYYEQHLKYHSYVHSAQKNFECDICLQRFVAPNALAMHKKTIHSSDTQFGCLECGKTFNRKHHLEAHNLTHKKQAQKFNSRENCASNRKINILKTKPQTKLTTQTNAEKDESHEIDENTMETMNDQSDENVYLMGVIESCSETDNQIESDNYNYC